MRKIIQLAAAHPWLVIAGLFLITALAATRLDGLEIHVSAEGMMVENGPARQFYEQHLQTYGGSDSPTIVVLQDQALFSHENLTAIRQTINRLEALPQVEQTLSLFSIKNVKNVDDEIKADGFFEPMPQTPAEAQAVRKDALSNPLITENLLSRDGKTMAINVFLKQHQDKPNFDEAAVRAIDEVLQPLAGQLQQAFQIGSPYVRQAISEKIREDQSRILPLALVVLLLTLALALRHLHGAIIPLLTAGISVVWTLALMAILGIPVNVMTSIVPALIIIIGSTEDVHLISEYLSSRQAGKTVSEALGHMGNKMGMAVLLTFITTYLGFLSIVSNDISLLKQFGLVASTGLLINFIVTTLLVPASLRVLDRGRQVKTKRQGSFLLQHIVELFHSIHRQRKTSISAIIVIALISLYGATMMRVNNNPMEYFDDDSALKQRAGILQQSLSGMQTFSIVLSSGIEGTFQKVRYLNELKRLQDHIESSSQFDKTFSFADYVGLLHAVMEGNLASGISLPDEDAYVREYMLFIKRPDIQGYVSEDFSETRIVVRHHIDASFELKQALEGIQAYAGEHLDRGLQMDITGESILTNQAADYMATGQARSLFLMVIVIWLIIAFLFVNMKAGLMAVIPNLFPIVVLFGVMGYFGIPLDTGTSMVAAIALGICVDDTMHFMVRYHHHTRHSGGSREQALAATVRDESMPIIATSVALALGFAALAISGFPPVVHFGLLSAMVMILALLATFIITPLLLSTTQLVTMYDMMSLQLRKKIFDACELFYDMNAWQIKKIILVSEVKEYQDGQMIIQQGDRGNEMYVVLNGSVDVWSTNTDGTLNHITSFSDGDVFGEVALVAETERTANISAAGPTRVLVLDWEGIRKISRIFPRIAARLFLNLSAILGTRLANSHNKVATIQDEVSGAYTSAFFEGLLKLELERSDRFDEPFSLLFLDVSATGENPESGTQMAAENFIQKITQEISDNLRKIDIGARLNKDRFVYMLTRTEKKKVDAIVTRIMQEISSDDFREDNLRASISAMTYVHGDDQEAFMGKAMLQL